MKISFVYEKKRKFVSLRVVHGDSRKLIKICDALPSHWNENAKMINSKHPEFEYLYPYMNEILLKANRLKIARVSDVNSVINTLLNEQEDDPDLLAWLKKYLSDRKKAQDKYDKTGNLQERNRISGHIKRYYTIQVKLEQYYKQIPYSSITKWWVRQLQQKLIDDTLISDSTVTDYLSRIKSLYGKMILDCDLPDSNAFKQPLFKGSVRAYESRKKRLDNKSLKLLSSVDCKGNVKRARDTFMVLFDLCGCDLTDLYFLKRNQINNGRIFLERSKVRGSSMDLIITERIAQYIEDYANVKGVYLFPWRKDVDGYKTWRDNARRDLRKAAKMANIKDVSGGNISMKCARHTFASRAKELGVDGDLLRELMGHRRNDIDNYYKEAYPEKIRNKAQFKVTKL